MKIARKVNVRSSRSGAAAVEFAICLPVMLLLIVGSLEACNMAFLNQTLSVSSYEGARSAIRFNSSNDQALAKANEILTARNVVEATVTFDPADVAAAEKGTWIAVTVSAPCAPNCGTPMKFFSGRSITVTSTMVKE
jgi:Flp pilus assembly protein TadG